tara:strand:+ start:51 stop:509 length:459 start_codon:yes stop_codon:yes gene_type:complete
MPLLPLNGPISIDTRDLNQNATIGVLFPLMNEGTWLPSYTIKEQAKTNILNVLLTEKGERVYMPEFGVGLKQVLFENNVDAQEVKDRIINQVNYYVPEIEVVNLDVNVDEHLLQIVLSYALILSGETDAIEINVNGSPQSDGIDLTQSATGF